mmetsp:Transcript_14890/g.30905  ORF Transcript_14890/g.30905 Transcript_14890/m.30905 type:complete len:279 (-) Transcript_14890:118-954(-)
MLRRRKKVAPSDEGGENELKERLLGSDDNLEAEEDTSGKRCEVTVLQHTLNYLTYIVEKVALWVFGSGGTSLSDAQREQLAKLARRIGVKYDQARHGVHLETLWQLAFGEDVPFVEGKTKKWQEMGWQGDHPSSDFRGGGFAALENLIYFGESKPLAFQRLCFKLQGKRSDWEYPFGAAGVNITFTLAKLLDLKGDGAPATGPGRAFLKLLDVGDAEHEKAFEEVFCMTFELLDKIWLEENADYMQFPIVMKQWEETLTKALLKRPSSLAQLEEFLMK